MTKKTFEQNLALIGAGYWGKNLARNFYELGALHTLCDAKESTLDQFEGKYPGVHLTSNFSSVLDNPKITRVALASPAMQHYRMAKEVLLAGKDLYVEKPLCLDSSEGEELVRLAEEQKLILMTGHLLHYHPCVKHLKQMVNEGALGKLQYIVSNRLNLGAIRVEENALWNFAPHDISVILALCGGTLPNQVRCMGAAYLSKGVADTSLTTLRFENELRAHIYVSWLNPFKEQKLVVVGSHGMVVFDDTLPWEDKLVFYSEPVRWDERQLPYPVKTDGEKLVVPRSEPLQNECIHFLECCNTRATPDTDGKEGLRVVNVLQAAQASLNEDGEAKYPQKYYDTRVANQPSHFIHPTAMIDPGAKIGDATKIWHFTHVMGGTAIGHQCTIGQNVFIASGVTVGSKVKIQNNVSLYTGTIVEDEVFIGPSAVFTNIVNPRSAVPRKDQYLATYVRKGVSIGANATIVCGVELGDHAFIGAGAVVTKDVKPYALMVGNPARQIGWMSRYGEKIPLPLAIDPQQERTFLCPYTGDAYSLKGDRMELAAEGSKQRSNTLEPVLTV